MLLAGNHWQNAANRKQFFDFIAQQLRFDALVAENWYPLSIKDIMQFKVYKNNYQAFLIIT